MQSATRKSESAVPEAAGRRPVAATKKAKVSVLLVSRDDQLWPQIGAHLGSEFLLKQVDSLEELVTATPAGHPAIVLLDARALTDAASVLSQLQIHSPRFAMVVLDDSGSAHVWTNPIVLRQVVAHVGVPILPNTLKTALDSAHEEVNARVALLGDASAAAQSAPSAPRRFPWIPASIILGVLIASVAAYVALRHNATPVKPPPAASAQHAPVQSVPPPAAAEEKVDLLIEKAEQAMLDRHFIDPADGSALTLYRNALRLDPDNGEAHQGLQRLAEILFTRVQSALDERKFDVALQALETARSINPNDSRLSALDERIATLRAEIGPAQILAAINAQNFERAAQLIDEAARSKSLNNAKLGQLRDELRRRHAEFDIANFVKLVDTRLQQDKLVQPRTDSAAYYLGQAKAAGASAAALQPQSQELFKRLSQTLHASIDQRRFVDADRLLADMHAAGYSVSATSGLQHDLNAARAQQTAAVPEQPQYLDLAQSRLAQGKLTEPDNDSALYYLNQLRTVDPKNSSLSRISSAVQAQILVQARAALDATDPVKAEALLQIASGLGASADLNSLNDRLAQMKLTSGTTVLEAELTRVRPIDLDYPPLALSKNVEGWVELYYVVTAEGKVTKVKVLQSSPAGVFDSAATKGLLRARYKPVVEGGKAVAVNTKLRIAFRMQK